MRASEHLELAEAALADSEAPLDAIYSREQPGAQAVLLSLAVAQLRVAIANTQVMQELVRVIKEA